jgi:hypothetical protein
MPKKTTASARSNGGGALRLISARRLASGCEPLARCGDEVSRKRMIPSNGDQLTYRHAQLERHHPTTHRGSTDDAISDRQQI